MEKEIKNEPVQPENINEDKSMYDKIASLIKSVLPKTPEETKESSELNTSKTQPSIKLQTEYENLKNELNKQKQIIKETQSLNLLKSSGLDESLKDLITHHPNPKEAIESLKAFKDSTLKLATSYTPMGAENKKENKLYMFDSIGEK